MRRLRAWAWRRWCRLVGKCHVCHRSLIYDRHKLDCHVGRNTWPSYMIVNNHERWDYEQGDYSEETT